MTKLLLGWLASTIALLIVANVVPGFAVSGFQSALIAAVVIGFINGTLGAVIKFFTFPFRILTLGLLSLVINAVMLLVADALLDGLTINSFTAAFLGSILLSIVTTVLRWLIPDGKDGKD
jgi:putative membrane protein